MAQIMPVPGCIGVSRTDTWTGKAIQYGTRSRWNHAGILEEILPRPFASNYPEVIVLEATAGGFKRNKRFMWSFHWDMLDLPILQRQKIIQAGRECIGLPYDWKDIASFIWRFNKVKLTNKPYPDHPDDRVICSEAAAWAFRRGTGIDPWPGVAAGEISPGDIEQALWHPDPKLGFKFRSGA